MWQHQTAVAVDIHHTKGFRIETASFFVGHNQVKPPLLPFFRSNEMSNSRLKISSLDVNCSTNPLRITSNQFGISKVCFARTCAGNLGTNKSSQKNLLCFKRGRFRRESFHNLTTCHWKSLRKHHNNRRWKCHKPPGHHWWDFQWTCNIPPYIALKHSRNENSNLHMMGIVLTGHPWYHNSFQRHHWCVKTWNEWNLPDSHRGGRWKLPPNG